MANLMSLPIEVIDIILSYSDISFEDIINFKCVCKKFRSAVSGRIKESYHFPEEKYLERWPSAKKYYDDQFHSEENEEKNEKYVDFIAEGIYYAKELRNYIRIKMSILKSNTETYDYEEENILETMFINNLNLRILFFIDEIKHVLAEPPRGCDLTEKYCWTELFNFLRMRWRKYKLYNFEEQSHKELFEQSITKLAQQLRPGKDVSYSSVKKSLNIIALNALNFLRKKHPKHSIFSTTDNYFSNWENHEINNNHWGKAEGTQIMDMLEEYIFGKLNFQATSSRELECMCIDYVLENKCGNEIILLVIYQSVARRLGLRCDLVTKQSYQRYTSLFWMPNYNIFPTDYKNDINILIKEMYKVNVRFLNITCYKFPDCLGKKCHLNGPIYKQPFSEILQISFKMESEQYRLCNFVKDIVTVHDVMNDYSFLKTRSGVKFAVGMIVTHGDESTDCSIGVIIGWYINYSQNLLSTNFIHEISNYIMPLKDCSNYSAAWQRIYYIILTKSDKLCHVEQDDITLTKPSRIKNRDIYKYFSKFEGTHYVPNKELARVYPNDAAITARTIFEN